MADEKYVVFKWEEFSKWYQTVDSHGDTVPMSLDDAVVIRRQDVFAPPALDAYANSIFAAVEVLKNTNADPEVVARLHEIADYFHGQAVMAWATERKLPD